MILIRLIEAVRDAIIAIRDSASSTPCWWFSYRSHRGGEWIKMYWTVFRAAVAVTHLLYVYILFGSGSHEGVPQGRGGVLTTYPEPPWPYNVYSMWFILRDSTSHEGFLQGGGGDPWFNTVPWAAVTGKCLLHVIYSPWFYFTWRIPPRR